MADTKNVVVLDGVEIVLEEGEIISEETLRELSNGKEDNE